MAGSSLWKTILLPPLAALLIYLFSIYVLLPLYRQRIRYSSYLPLPLSLSENTASPGSQSLLSRTRDRILLFLSPYYGGMRWQRRGSGTDSADYFGDEELEEGFEAGDEVVRSERETGDERRLSRELEVGFRDDSDDEEGESDERRGRQTNRE